MPTLPSTPVEALLSLFATRLADVRFPDVDAASLVRLSEKAHASTMTVATAEATLEAAKNALREQQDELLRAAHRAVAYARVYAAGDAAVTAELDAIALPRGARRAAPAQVPEPGQSTPKRRGRPRKSDAGEHSLELPATAAE